MALIVEFHRLIAPSRPWILGGDNELAGQLQLSAQAQVSYPDGTLDTLPALTAALLPDGVTTMIDWVHDRWVGYTVKGSGILSVVKESLLASLDGTICPLCWVHDDEVHPFQITQVGTLGPAIPTISGALCGSADVGFEPTITWTSVPDATDYELEVGTDPTFATSFIDVTVSGGATSYTVVTPLSASTVYYVRVRETAPEESDWSGGCSFTTGLFDDVPHIIYPPDMSTQIYLSPVYQWTGVSGATSYEIEVATNSGFTSIIFDEVGIASLLYQFPVYIALTMQTDYWVRARVYAPSLGSWGPANKFSTYLLGTAAARTGEDSNHETNWVAVYTDDPLSPAYGKPAFSATDWTIVLFIKPATDISHDADRNTPVLWAMGQSGSMGADIYANGPAVPTNAGKLSAIVGGLGASSGAGLLNAAGAAICIALVSEGVVGNIISLYYNGTLVATGPHGGGIIATRMGFGYMGFVPGGPGAFQAFNGVLRNVQYYKNKLSGSDIASISSTGLPIATASSALFSVWPCDEGTGHLLQDICADLPGDGHVGGFGTGIGSWAGW